MYYVKEISECRSESTEQKEKQRSGCERVRVADFEAEEL
jgi:hypothetical protein